MDVVVLAGGYGGARLAATLSEHLAGAGGADHGGHLTVIANVADDVRLHDLYISPDLDTIMYTLGGGLDTERGWGRRDEAFRTNEELALYGVPTWFGLGDRDLATHLVRSQMRRAGYSLTQVTAALCRRWGLEEAGVTLLPVTDDRVETHVVMQTDAGPEAVHFQEWWIRHGAQPRPQEFVQVGLSDARPSREAIAAIQQADLIVLAPSNPVVSIGPILAVPGVSQAIVESPAPVVGVSPIISGRPLRGMADTCLNAIGVDVSAEGVASHYGAAREGGLLDTWIIDTADAGQQAAVTASGIDCVVTGTVMDSPAVRAGLTAAILAQAGS